MIKYGLGHYLNAEFIAERGYKKYANADHESDHQGVLTSQERQAVLDDLQRMLPACHQLDLDRSLSLVNQFFSALTLNHRDRLYRDIATRFEILWQTMGEEGSKIEFALVPLTKAKYFEQDDLFGGPVSNRFKKARYDIKEAGNCLATGANTACVFHLMRVAEHGLRALARRFDIKLVNTTTRRPKPIEEATWQEIIDEVNLEIRNARNRATLVQEKRLEAYLHLNMACKAIKHLWRNPVSHLRGSYPEAKANKIFSSIRDLMQNACVVLSGSR